MTYNFLDGKDSASDAKKDSKKKEKEEKKKKKKEKKDSKKKKVDDDLDDVLKKMKAEGTQMRDAWHDINDICVRIRSEF